jgi:GntR family transcriptional regulator of vanillate catabolism
MNNQQTRPLVRIREMILQGKLSAGQRVAEAPLAERLGMSRTPVRQALPVLAQEGLLVEHETRGDEPAHRGSRPLGNHHAGASAGNSP